VVCATRGKKHPYLRCFFAPRVSRKRENTAYLTIFGHYETEKKTAGVTADITNNTTTASIWVWLFCFIVFCVFSVVTYFAPIRFYKQTTLRTEIFAQSSFYVQILLHRKVCAQINFYTQTPLHTEVFTQRSLPTEVFIHRCFAQRCIYTHRDRHTGTFTHRTFYTEKPLHRTVFTQRNFYTGKLWHRTICPHRLHKEVFTHRNFCTQKLYPGQLLHTDFFPHRSLSAQKSLCTAFFTQGPFTHRCLYSLYTEKLLHTEASAQSTLLHTASFYTERLCFPFLITCLSCSPLRYCCM